MTDILAVCVALAVLAGGAAVVAKLLSVIKRVHNALDDWQGEPERPGVPARPGVMERLAAIEAQLKPNGGHSTRDVVNRVEQTVRQIEHALTAPDSTEV
ncbi:hypothetical protein ACQPYK_08520 [Streptosporangium sp. CA-135522]|uniref:hypothetical protein n=1 Tax=Streptosporangium sp. CA-135522 TaxID=3240072 RepID=UPI003D8F96AD